MRFLSCRLICGIPLLAALASAQPPAPQASQKHNVIIFVADGLRRGSVNAQDMPTFLKVRATGVDFQNSHSVFPTFTTANASVIATGHGLGDTGDYSNVLYPGTWLTKPDVTALNGSVMPFLESDELLADMNSTFNGNYLGERTLLSVARERVASMSLRSAKLVPRRFSRTKVLSGTNSDTWGATARLLWMTPPVNQAGFRSRARFDRRSAMQSCRRRRRYEATVLQKRHLGTTDSPVTPRLPEPWMPIVSSNNGSPTWLRRCCCRSLPAMPSRLCWCSGRAIPTALSTTRGIACRTSPLESTEKQ